MTLLSLAPAAEITWPGFIKWARHRASIRAAEQSELWLKMTSTTELCSNGLCAGKVAKEQDRILGERLASWFKMPNFKDEGIKSMMDFFVLEPTGWDFAESVMEFCYALSMLLHHAAIGDLDERIELLGDAVSTVKQACANQTCCGNAINGWPKATKILTNAQKHQEKAIVTKQKQIEIWEDLAVARLYMEEQDECFREKLEADVCVGFVKKAFAQYVNAEQTCLMEFLPSPLDPVVRGVTGLFSRRSINAVISMLELVMVKEASQELLIDWSKAMIDKAFFAEVISVFRCPGSLFNPTNPDVAFATRLHGFFLFLMDLAGVALDGFKDADACDGVWKVIAQSTEPFPDATDASATEWANKQLTETKISPVLRPDGPVMAQLRTGCESRALDLTRPVLQQMFKVVDGTGCLTADLLKVDSESPLALWDKETLDAFLAWHAEEPAIAAAAQWASRAGDDRLHNQISG